MALIISLFLGLTIVNLNTAKLYLTISKDKLKINKKITNLLKKLFQLKKTGRIDIWQALENALRKIINLRSL